MFLLTSMRVISCSYNVNLKINETVTAKKKTIFTSDEINWGFKVEENVYTLDEWLVSQNQGRARKCTLEFWGRAGRRLDLATPSTTRKVNKFVCKTEMYVWASTRNEVRVKNKGEIIFELKLFSNEEKNRVSKSSILHFVLFLVCFQSSNKTNKVTATCNVSKI